MRRRSVLTRGSVSPRARDPPANRGARALEDLWALAEHPEGVGEQQRGLDLEDQLIDVLAFVDLPPRLGLDRLFAQAKGPAAHEGRDPVAHAARAGVELAQDRREEAAAGEDAALDVDHEP